VPQPLHHRVLPHGQGLFLNCCLNVVYFKNRFLCFYLGYYVPLSTLAEVREQVLHYIPVMARPLVLTRNEHPINWTPVYADITVSIDVKHHNACNTVHNWKLQTLIKNEGKILFFILIPCIIDYVEINQLNALNYILLYFSFTMAPTFFGKI
jgi:hypothetical protein